MTSESTQTPMPAPDWVSAQQRPDGQLNDKLGIKVIDYNPARVVATMPVAGNLQPFGMLHGGASAALAEAVGSNAAALNSEPGTASVGTQVITNHHKATRSGTVTAVAVPLHLGRSLKTFGIEIRDDAGNLVASAQLTAMTLPKPPGEKSKLQ